MCFIKRNFGKAGTDVTQVLVTVGDMFPNCEMGKEEKGEKKAEHMWHFRFFFLTPFVAQSALHTDTN